MTTNEINNTIKYSRRRIFFIDLLKLNSLILNDLHNKC